MSGIPSAQAALTVSAAEAPPAKRLRRVDRAAPRLHEDVGREGEREQQARNEAGGEDADQRLLGDRGIEDHRDRGRDHVVDQPGRGDEPGGEAHVVAGIDHRLEGDAADRRDGRRRRPRDGAEHDAGPDRGDRQAGLGPSQQRFGPIDQPAGNSAVAHDLAGKDEERHRQQRRAVQGSEHHLVQRGGRYRIEIDDHDRRGRQQDHEDRKAEHQQDDRQQRHRPDHVSNVM